MVLAKYKKKSKLRFYTKSNNNLIMLLEINNPRDAIIGGCTKPIIYKNYILFRGNAVYDSDDNHTENQGYFL